MIYLDLLGAVLSLLSTLLYTRENINAWPMGLLACGLNFLLYANRGIYADAYLEITYVFITFYGWYQWLYGSKEKTPIHIRHITFHEIILLLSIGAVSSGLIGFYLAHYTDSTIPYLDAGTTIFSLIGQWLICKKIIETWLVWFVVDGIYVWLYMHKAIPFHSILMMLYLGIALWGYYRWRQSLNKVALPESMASA
jgi:nicotinamide mononucleotide transporter